MTLDEKYIAELLEDLVAARALLRTICGKDWAALIQFLGLEPIPDGLVHSVQKLLAKPHPTRGKINE